ncbi:MAG: sensor signal transduction histidine kinase/response regulator [Verrucomicrobiales bacterium]|nr:sensor signal transduction histidine kinase/response regulator [Verrucomicrobiales bacterium]
MRKRILVVDDEPQITKIISLILRGADAYEVETCNDPLEAYARVMTNSYDLLILDVQMPLAGDQLSASIQTAVEEGMTNYKPKILLISGALSGEQMFNMRHDIDATTFLMKPFHPGTLQQIVATVLNGLTALVEPPSILAA